MEVKTVAVFVLLGLGACTSLTVNSPCPVPDDKNLSRISAADEECDTRVAVSDGIDSQDDEGDVSAKARITKRQIIKIPSGVTKVKVIGSEPVRQKRIPSGKQAYDYPQKSRPPRRYHGHRPSSERDEDYEDAKRHRNHDLDGLDMKKHKVYVKEVTPEEFFNDATDYHYLPGVRVEEVRGHHKKPKKHQGKASHKYYASSEESGRPLRFHGNRHKEEITHEKKKSHKNLSKSKEYSRSGSDRYNEYEEFGATNVHMRQVPAPNLSPWKTLESKAENEESRLETHRWEKDNVRADFSQNKVASVRESESAYPQQYTSHNPYVMTNFGLNDGKSRYNGYSGYKSSYPGYDGTTGDAFDSVPYKQKSAASEQHPTTVLPGIKVVQPPQLGSSAMLGDGMTTTSEGTPVNQRATIRDILHQDCPDYDILGFCSSPPRYPTVQITAMMTKCLDLQEVMKTPVPSEPRDDLSSFASRSDNELDIVFDDEHNGTLPEDTAYYHRESWPEWSRSGTESETACDSRYAIIEPGYAREVTSGRWFVIVQNADSALQKVTTDTCSSPGKPCGGLAGMKCSRSRGFRNGIKSTRCIQRYTHQRLISWDPESPSKCPQIRIFRFPTACVCHLGLT